MNKTCNHLARLITGTFILLILLGTFQSAQAQVEPATNSYWRYSASLRLQHVHQVDINHDGIDELLTTTENGEVDLIGSDGILLWQYGAAETVHAISTINIDGPDHPEREIVLALTNRLVVLSADGKELWETAVSATSPPPSLYAYSGNAYSQSWQTQYDAIPTAVSAIDRQGDGWEDIVVLLQSGQLHLYDRSGTLAWRYTRSTTPGLNAEGRFAVGDLNNDGQEEIVLSTFRRFSQMTIIDGSGAAMWDQPIGISGRVTAMTLVDFPEFSGMQIAVGTDRGNLNLYSSRRTRIWPRTLNKPITTLNVASLETGQALIVGTQVGTVTAFSSQGQRLWARRLSEEANRPILTIDALPYLPDDRQPYLSVILGSETGGPEPNDIWLLGKNGRTLDTLEAEDTIGATRITDINRDQNSELLITRFASVELVGIGLGSREQAQEWRYSLESAPRSVLVTDIDQDGEEELLVGAQNGRLLCLNRDKRLCWLTAPGDPITHLGALQTISSNAPNIVAVRSRQINAFDEPAAFQSRLEVRQADGERIWDRLFDGEITALLIENINDRGQPEIIVGTQDGQIIALTSTGTQLWSHTVEPPYLTESEAELEAFTQITKILPQQNPRLDVTDLLVGTPQVVYKINNNLYPRPIIRHESTITDLFLLDQPGGELATRILVLLQDGTVRGHHWDGIQLPQWPLVLDAVPTAGLPANEIITEAFQQSSVESFVVATDTNELIKIIIEANEPSIDWRQPINHDISSLFWEDLDGDTLPDLSIGITNDRVQLYANAVQRPDLVNELLLSGDVFAMTALQRGSELKDLAVLTQNGEIELFRAQENRPPLLTNPLTESRPGQISFSIDVMDVEQDEVTVELQVQNENNPDQWLSYGSRTTNSNDPLFWPAIDISSRTSVNYQFVFTDGSYDGTIAPPPLPAPPLPSPLTEASPLLLGMLALVGVGTAVLFTRQAQQPAAKAQRFYRRLISNPTLTLPRLEEMYIRKKGSQDFLLNLAGQARQQENTLLTNLADGLFLLPDRPNSGLSIILNTLENPETQQPAWVDQNRWLQIFTNAQALITAPTITELSLLRPQLVQLLTQLDQQNQWSPILDALLPIMTSLRDSERVDEAEDRIVYLNEALHQLYDLQLTLPEFSTRIEKTLVQVIIDRWLGLVNADAEELRGRAELIITLKTKRLVSTAQTELVVEVGNNGRAPAENILVTLDDDPAFEIVTTAQTISFLPPGRQRQVSFAVVPKVIDRFRAAFTIIFDDRNQQGKHVAFADMVHLLLPVRHFSPITNPYLPGTPLRPTSTVFYGRDRLFHFIAENVGGLSQRNVLILIGHRRTGKTSALLRLGDRLPSFLLPVYIDCQSLGVLPGMPALFNDLAWLIADVLAAREIEADVPPPEVWEKDPTGTFQRQFLPYVRSLLPEETRLLLVFDEFEAFESLVEDNILPPTFFTFMRHLMQHSEGLGFVFVGTQRLEEMSADYWSVLFNIALYEHIRYLSEEAAVQLISEPVAPHLIYDDLAIDKILRVTAGHPYFLQLVCYTLVKRANAERTGYVTISDVNAGLDEMLSLGEVHFAYLWQRSSYVERAILTAVAHMMDKDIAFHPEDFIEYLQSYGIHLDPTEVTTALNSLVSREIMQEASHGVTIQYELRIGLVGLWVAKQKSLSKLHADGHQRDKRPLFERS